MTKTTRPKILGVGFAAEGFGFGRVFRSLYERLGANWEIEHLEFSPPGNQTVQTPWLVHHTRRPAFYLGQYEFAELVERRRPDLVFLSGDLWQIPPYLQALSDTTVAPRTVAYCPVDGVMKAGTSLLEFQQLDRLVTATNFGKNEVCSSLASLGASKPLAVEVIPHGLDAGRFYPYESIDGKTGRKRAREELFPNQPELAEAFIVLNANRNTNRKRFDLTLDGFARFAAGKPPGVKLYLHAGTIDQGINFVAEANRLGVLDRILTTTNKRDHPVVSDTELNRIYNACDVGVNTSTGEGWGLVAFEHAATRAAQVVPRHSACAELWNEAATLLPTAPIQTSSGNWFQGGEVPAESLAEALEHLYTNRVYLEQQADAGWRNACREELTWDAVAGRFEQLFLNVLKTPQILRNQ